jgi:hypothetical protein
MRRRFKIGSRFAIRPDAPSRIVKPRSTPAKAASTTPATSPFTALAADMTKRPSVILPHTGSTKTATEHNRRTNGGFNHVSQQSNRGRQFRS